MKRALLLSSVVLILSSSLTLAVPPQSAEVAPAARPGLRTLIDMDGRKVALPPATAIRRVAILTSPQVQIVYVLGRADRLCAATSAVQKWSLLHELDPRLHRVPAVRAGAGQVNLEALLLSQPDLCIGSATDLASVEAATPIPTLHIAVPGSRPGGAIAQIEREVGFLGDVFGRSDRAHAYSEFLRETRLRVTAVANKRSATAPPRVFMGFGPAHLTTYGGDTFMQELMAAGACRNAAESLRSLGGKEGGLSNVSLEQVLAWSPDWLVIDDGDAEALRRDPAWAAVPAVAAGRVLRLPVGVFIWNRPSAESAVMLPLWLASQVHPTELPASDLARRAERFYRDVFGLPVTTATVARILGR